MGKSAIFFWICVFFCLDNLEELHPFNTAIREYKIAFSWQKPAQIKAIETY